MSPSPSCAVSSAGQVPAWVQKPARRRHSTNRVDSPFPQVSVMAGGMRPSHGMQGSCWCRESREGEQGECRRLTALQLGRSSGGAGGRPDVVTCGPGGVRPPDGVPRGTCRARSLSTGHRPRRHCRAHSGAGHGPIRATRCPSDEPGRRWLIAHQPSELAAASVVFGQFRRRWHCTERSTWNTHRAIRA
jgi:hypothetical protein